MARPVQLRRNTDGSIDIRFHRRRASRLRAIARRRAGQRLWTLVIAVRDYVSRVEPPLLRARHAGP